MENDIERQIIYGKNAVSEALNSDKEIDTLFAQKGITLGNIIPNAKKRGIVVKDGTQFYVYIGDEGYRDYAVTRKGWMNFNELLRNINDDMKLMQRIEQFLKRIK